MVPIRQRSRRYGSESRITSLFCTSGEQPDCSSWVFPGSSAQLQHQLQLGSETWLLVFIISRPPLASSAGGLAGGRAGWELGELVHPSHSLRTQWDTPEYDLDMLGGVATSVNDAIQLCQTVNDLSAVSLLCIAYWNILLTYSVSGLPDTCCTKIMIL